MKAKDIMTKVVVSVNQNSSVTEAADKMKSTDVGSLAVEDNNKMVGMITDRDIVLRSVASNGNETCGDIMSRDVVTCSPNTDVDEVASLMARHQVKRIPVVDNGSPVGMISLADLSQAQGLKQETMNALSNITEKTEEHYQ